jgi:hypothetical protein
VLVTTPQLSLEFQRSRGGLLSLATDSVGAPLCSDQAIYTDWGIYPDRMYAGTVASAAELKVAQDGDTVVVTASGILTDQAGGPPGPPGRVGYQVWYTITDEPHVRVAWSATPEFTTPTGAAFYSFILQVQDCRGLIARTDRGVLLQDMASVPGRSFQSSLEPLDIARPLLGLVRNDGTVLVFADVAGRPDLANVFVHEDGRGGAGIFFAWLCGEARNGLRAGDAWEGSFGLLLVPSVEAALDL